MAVTVRRKSSNLSKLASVFRRLSNRNSLKKQGESPEVADDAKVEIASAPLSPEVADDAKVEAPLSPEDAKAKAEQEAKDSAKRTLGFVKAEMDQTERSYLNQLNALQSPANIAMINEGYANATEDEIKEGLTDKNKLVALVESAQKLYAAQQKVAEAIKQKPDDPSAWLDAYKACQTAEDAYLKKYIPGMKLPNHFNNAFKLHHNTPLSLADCAITPVQRVPRYRLLAIELVVHAQKAGETEYASKAQAFLDHVEPRAHQLNNLQKEFELRIVQTKLSNFTNLPEKERTHENLNSLLREYVSCLSKKYVESGEGVIGGGFKDYDQTVVAMFEADPVFMSAVRDMPESDFQEQIRLNNDDVKENIAAHVDRNMAVKFDEIMKKPKESRGPLLQELHKLIDDNPQIDSGNIKIILKGMASARYKTEEPSPAPEVLNEPTPTSKKKEQPRRHTSPLQRRSPVARSIDRRRATMSDAERPAKQTRWFSRFRRSSVEKDYSKKLVKRNSSELEQIIDGRVHNPDAKKYADDLKDFATQRLRDLAPESMQSNPSAFDDFGADEIRLQSFVINDILKQENPQDIQDKYFFYTSTLHECLKNNDYHSAFAIYNALNNFSIERLADHKTKSVNGETQLVQNEKSCIKVSESDAAIFLKCTKLFAIDGVFSNYATAVLQDQESHESYVPMISKLKKKLFEIGEKFKDPLKSTQSQISALEKNSERTPEEDNELLELKEKLIKIHADKESAVIEATQEFVKARELVVDQHQTLDSSIQEQLYETPLMMSDKQYDKMSQAVMPRGDGERFSAKHEDLLTKSLKEDFQSLEADLVESREVLATVKPASMSAARQKNDTLEHQMANTLDFLRVLSTTSDDAKAFLEERGIPLKRVIHEFDDIAAEVARDIKKELDTKPPQDDSLNDDQLVARGEVPAQGLSEADEKALDDIVVEMNELSQEMAAELKADFDDRSAAFEKIESHLSMKTISGIGENGMMIYKDSRKGFDNRNVMARVIDAYKKNPENVPEAVFQQFIQGAMNDGVKGLEDYLKSPDIPVQTRPVEPKNDGPIERKSEAASSAPVMGSEQTSERSRKPRKLTFHSLGQHRQKESGDMVLPMRVQKSPPVESPESLDVLSALVQDLQALKSVLAEHSETIKADLANIDSSKMRGRPLSEGLSNLGISMPTSLEGFLNKSVRSSLQVDDAVVKIDDALSSLVERKQAYDNDENKDAKRLTVAVEQACSSLGIKVPEAKADEPKPNAQRNR